MDLSKPGGDDELAEEERRRRQEQAGSEGGAGADPADSSWCDIGSGGLGCDSCDIPDCDIPDCDCGGCNLLRLSTVLAMVALVVPAGAGGLVAALIRFYQRSLAQLTPACPSTPSCSAYALAAVETLGARRGMAAAARRIRACGIS